MEFDSGLAVIDIPLKVIAVDLLLGGDNAVLIALACRSLPPLIMRRAILFGTGFAIVLRFVMTLLVGSLMSIPYLKLAGAAALMVIAIQLMMGEEDGDKTGDSTRATENLWVAVRLIVVADVIMSIDNVVALAAVAQGSFFYLALGLLLSVPLLIYGSEYVGRLLHRYPILVTAGGAMLAWTAGDIAVSDPAIAQWVDTQSFALHAAAPLAAALFAILHSRNLAEQRRLDPASADRQDYLTGKVMALVRFVDEHWNGKDETALVVVPTASVEAPKPVEPEPVEAKVAAPSIDLARESEDKGHKDSNVLIIFVLAGAPLLLLALMMTLIWSASGL